MRRGHALLCAVVVSSLWAGAARATIVCDFVLQPGGLYNDPVDGSRVPASGGRREISVFLRNTNAINEGLGGFQTDYTADKIGATAVGALGGAGTTGTGSRFHSPDWDASTIGFGVLIPSGAIPVSPATLGFYGTVIVNGNPHAASHLVGWIVVDLAPKSAGSTITIQSANFQALGLFGDNLDAAIGQAATFVYVPEPTVLMLVLAAGATMCGRRDRALGGTRRHL